MSNYLAPTRHPITGRLEDAKWLDDYYGRHQYGIQFEDGRIFPQDQVEAVLVEKKGLPNPKDALGMKKVPLRFIPWAALVSLAYVMRSGAQKYGWMNWREHPVKRSVYHEAALRHLLSAMDGEDVDPESGQPHEAHVIACMAILLDAKANGKLIDDRPASGAFGRLVQGLTEKDEREDHQDERPRLVPRFTYTSEGRYEPEYMGRE